MISCSRENGRGMTRSKKREEICMMGLQRFLRKMKKLDTCCDKVRSDEKSRRIRILGVSAAATACLVFTDLPFGGQDTAAADGVDFGAVFSNMDALHGIEISDLMDIGTVHAGEEKELLEIFGGSDWPGDGKASVQGFETDWDISDKMLISADSIGNPKEMPEAGDKLDKTGTGTGGLPGQAGEGTGTVQDAVSKSGPEETAKEMQEGIPAAPVPAGDVPAGLTLAYNAGYCMDLPAEQRKVLETIVEAEAGDEDVYGKILVANVVLNRVLDDEFPDTVKEVVFQSNGRTYQFSPVRKGGRYYTVTVSEHTKAAVARALNGEDYSGGALYFFARKYTSSAKAKWFDTALEKITEYGCHEFFGNK